MNTWILTSFDLLTLRSSLTDFHRDSPRMPSLRREALNVKTNWSHFWRARPDISTNFETKMPRDSQDFSKNHHFNHLFHLRWDLMNHFDDLSLGEQHFRVIDGLQNGGSWSGWEEILWMIWWCQLIYAICKRDFRYVYMHLLCEVMISWCSLTYLTGFSFWESFRACSEHFLHYISILLLQVSSFWLFQAAPERGL